MSVPHGRAEQARAVMLELFPEGFEELEHADGLELVAYTDAGGEERLWNAFGAAAASAVPPDWEQRWRRFHMPVVVDGLWIGPPWETPPDGTAAVIIEPARAFGTGAHPTTRLALHLLGGMRRGSLLDVGCGSGVLAIAAAKLGFDPVVAVDVEDAAVEATRRNADANGVSVTVARADALHEDLPRASVAVANVTHEVVEQVAARVDAEAFVASGYLLSDPPPVVPRLEHHERVGDAGWAADAYLQKAK